MFVFFRLSIELTGPIVSVNSFVLTSHFPSVVVSLSFFWPSQFNSSCTQKLDTFHHFSTRCWVCYVLVDFSLFSLLHSLIFCLVQLTPQTKNLDKLNNQNNQLKMKIVHTNQYSGLFFCLCVCVGRSHCCSLCSTTTFLLASFWTSARICGLSLSNTDTLHPSLTSLSRFYGGDYRIFHLCCVVHSLGYFDDSPRENWTLSISSTSSVNLTFHFILHLMISSSSQSVHVDYCFFDRSRVEYSFVLYTSFYFLLITLALVVLHHSLVLILAVVILLISLHLYPRDKVTLSTFFSSSIHFVSFKFYWSFFCVTSSRI
jgi:hypothetical protein